jgi:hypothetical protein
MEMCSCWAVGCFSYIAAKASNCASNVVPMVLAFEMGFETTENSDIDMLPACKNSESGTLESFEGGSKSLSDGVGSLCC